MSYFLPEWIGGYEVFLQVGEMAWSPQIILKCEDLDIGHTVAAVSFFDVDMINDLVKLLGVATGNDFVDRLNGVTKFMYEKIGLNTFLKENMVECIKSNSTLDAASTSLTEKLWDLIFEFEIWNKVNIVEVFANLIFYGMWEFPNPFIFFVPPEKDWSTDGWSGYTPNE